jgi:hypothetical protein
MKQDVAVPNDTTVIRGKDLEALTGLAECAASKLLTDIKEEYNLKKVLYCHVKKYLAIP